MNENNRLLAVKRFERFDFDSNTELSEIVDMAARICKSPYAMVTLIDEDTEWFKVKKGTDMVSLPLSESFCAQTIRQDTMLLIPNAITDERYKHNAYVKGEPHIRFYAGASLITHDGLVVGTVCVLDTKVHKLNKNQQQMLKMLAKQAIKVMEHQLSVELLEKNQEEINEQRDIINNVKARLRSFFESSTNFHVLLGRNAEVVDFNKTAANFIERVHKKKLASNDYFVDFLAPEFVDTFVMRYEKALEGVSAYEEGSTDYGQHGIIWWEAAFEPARDANNNIIGISYLIRNVTERKHREQKIIDQNTSLLRIAHIQAHDFRAPLTSIMGLMNLIKDVDYAAPIEYFEMLDQAVHRLDDTIHNIMGDIHETVANNDVLLHETFLSAR